MLREGRPLGAITVAGANVSGFSERQVNLLKAFADQAVIAIENARLFERCRPDKRDLQESLEYQTATSEVLGVISRSPTDVQPVFDTIVKQRTAPVRADDVLQCSEVDGRSSTSPPHMG